MQGATVHGAPLRGAPRVRVRVGVGVRVRVRVRARARARARARVRLGVRARVRVRVIRPTARCAEVRSGAMAYCGSPSLLSHLPYA